MPTPAESRAALLLVTGAAVTAATELVASVTGTPEVQRAALLEAAPALVAYYADGSAALAADLYDDERERAGAPGRYVAEPVVVDRTEKLRNAVAWASAPLFSEVGQTVLERLAPVIQLESARPYRDTITTNRRRDRAAVGWRRIAGGGCNFCRLLAGRGAVYKKETARFASHPNCHCTAAPVFRGQDGEEASVLQYVASKRRRTEKQQQALRDALARMDDTKAGAKVVSAAKKTSGSAKVSAFDAMTREQVRQQISILEGLKDSEYRTTQLARLNARLKEL